MKALLLGLVTLVAHAASPFTLAAQKDADGLGALIRELVVNSLQGGGARAGALFVAADSASATLVRLADISLAPRPSTLVCPGSTEADGQPSPSPVGYVVQLALAVAPDTTARQLQITKSCGFHYRGRVRGFAEGGTWELRRERGRWRATAAFDLWTT